MSIRRSVRSSRSRSEREQADRSREASACAIGPRHFDLRRILGTIETVSASGPAAAIGRDPLGPKVKELPSLANLSVHLGGNEGISGRWSMGPALDRDIGRLTLDRSAGKAVLTMPARAMALAFQVLLQLKVTTAPAGTRRR